MYGFNIAGAEKMEQMLIWLWPFMLLDVLLKGIALWRSARKEQKVWFIFLLIVNSFGILPAIYLITNPQKKTNLKK